jgi:GAF domain-containing protein
MLWSLDEGAAVPLCVRTVDQGAPDGGLACSSSDRPAASMRLCCVGEPMVVEWAASAVESQRCAKLSFIAHLWHPHMRRFGRSKNRYIYPKRLPRRARSLLEYGHGTSSPGVVKEGCWGGRQWVTTPRGGAALLRHGTSVAVHHSSSEPKQGSRTLYVAPPLLVTVLCVPVVLGKAVWKVNWGVLYVGQA